MKRIPVPNQSCSVGVLALIFFFGINVSVNAEETERRMLFLGPAHPQIMMVTIKSGRFSIEQTRQKYAEGAFRRLDKDQDGTLNAEEAKQIPETGRLRKGEAVLGKKWEQFDQEPKDGAIDLKELQAYLASVAGPPLSVEMAPPKSTQTVRLYSELDLDNDGRIDSDEVSNGLNELQQFDFDDDETLSVAELQPFPNSVLLAQRQEQARNEPTPLTLLETDEQRMQAAQRCLDQYGDGVTLSEETMVNCLGKQARRFDKNRDRKFNIDELKDAFDRAQLELEMSVSLGPPKVNTSDSSAKGRPGRPLLNMGGVPVEMMARSNSWQMYDATRLYKVRFLMSDADKNGYLDQAEFNGLQATGTTFDQVDLDSNSQVTRDEIEEYFTLDHLAAQDRLIISVSNETTTLFEILDVDNDFRLEPQEFANGRKRLLEHDANQDGALTETEFAQSYRVMFTQPEILQTDPRTNVNAPQNRQGIVQQSVSGPIWFQRMDRNLDDVISWREFLGSRDDFNKLDSNDDGFLELNEAEQAEALRTDD